MVRVDRSLRLPLCFEGGVRIIADIGGPFGPTMRVEGDESGLVYEHQQEAGARPRTVSIMPPPAEWQRFGGTLAAIGVWDWEERYAASSGTTDGTMWAVTFDDGSRHLRSSGSNAYRVDSTYSAPQSRPSSGSRSTSVVPPGLPAILPSRRRDCGESRGRFGAPEQGFFRC